MPHSYNDQKRMILPNSGCFPAISTGHRDVGAGGAFLFRIPQMQCRTRTEPGNFSKFIWGAEHCGHLYGAVTPRSSKNGERLWKKGGNFHFPQKINTLFRCRIRWILWFCNQTWSNSMIQPSSGCSKLTVQRSILPVSYLNEIYQFLCMWYPTSVVCMFSTCDHL